VAAALVGILAQITAPPVFIAYWMAVGLVGVAGAFLLARRQALKAAEPFWSPPTRRVGQALFPPLFFGCVLGMVLLVRGSVARLEPGVVGELSIRWLPLAWIALYGCALHAAGFFMPRGMKIFGWALVLGGSALCASRLPELEPRYLFGHGVMGLFFGVAHLAYGVYLYFTEPRGNET
jgi:hypothetical protein